MDDLPGYALMGVIVAVIIGCIIMYNSDQQDKCHAQGGHVVELRRDALCMDPHGKILFGY